MDVHEPLSILAGKPERFELLYTPKHGSWLNMAEIEFFVLVRQCLDRRIPDKSILIREVKELGKIN